jgi:hypothetical protein
LKNAKLSLYTSQLKNKNYLSLYEDWTIDLSQEKKEPTKPKRSYPPCWPTIEVGLNTCPLKAWPTIEVGLNTRPPKVGSGKDNSSEGITTELSEL